MIESCHEDFSEDFRGRVFISLVFEKVDEFFDNGVLAVATGNENIV